MRVLRLASSLLLLLIMGSTFFACGIFDDDDSEEPAPFSMQVIPEHIEPSVPGQRCVFLVVVADEGEGNGEGKAVHVSATAPGSAVTVEPQAITPEQVAEVTVIPDEASAGETLTVTVHGERGGLEKTEIATLQVTEGGGDGEEDGLASMATEIRDKFIPWLATNHPELGITSETEWTGTIVRPGIVVVMYYLFFSEDWEMGVTWHVTIPPHNWAEIYLRHRFTEVYPSHAFKIDSWSEEGDPYAISPPESGWR